MQKACVWLAYCTYSRGVRTHSHVLYIIVYCAVNYALDGEPARFASHDVGLLVDLGPSDGTSARPRIEGDFRATLELPAPRGCRDIVHTVSQGRTERPFEERGPMGGNGIVYPAANSQVMVDTCTDQEGRDVACLDWRARVTLVDKPLAQRSCPCR